MNSRIKQLYILLNKIGKKRYLLIETNKEVINVLEKVIKPIASTFEVVTPFEGKNKYEEYVYKEIDIDFILTGIMMEGMDGFVITRDIFDENPDQKVIVFSDKEHSILYKTIFPEVNVIDNPINIELLLATLAKQLTEKK